MAKTLRSVGTFLAFDWESLRMVGVCVKMLDLPIVTSHELIGPHAEIAVAAFNVITLEHAEGTVAGPGRAGREPSSGQVRLPVRLLLGSGIGAPLAKLH